MVNPKANKLQIICCERNNCLYNQKDLNLTEKNISDLSGVRRILRHNNTEEVDACKSKLEKKMAETMKQNAQINGRSCVVCDQRMTTT